MENKCKRFLSLLLALVMVIGLMPMGHAHAEESAASINLALNKEATASSIGSNCGPELAVDGNTGSPQWNSVNMKNDNTGDEDDQDDQWLQVDLGTTGATIYEIKLWYNLKVWPMTYRIETTDTPEVGGSWETVVAVDRPSSNGWVVNGPGQDIADTSANTDTITTTSNPSLQMTVLKRYVRFYVEKVNAQAPGDNVNLREIQIFHQHDWTDATCTAPKTCSGCGATEGNALGHTAAAAVEENRVEATCTVAGSYDSVVYCSACGEELSRDTVTVPATGVHTPAAAVEENRTESTCTVAGSYDSVVYCSACGEELSRTKIDLELAAHTPGEAVEENRVESTCTVAGSYDSVVYCSVCNAEISRETKALELAAHTEEIIPGKAATCTETGLTDGVKCSVCGKILTAQEEIPMAA
ncbi:MAG: discoidin domain-containing protein, partial [Oscillospiraceae bacterium]|nr:discoidin domain-containing protein [Oscillospiraceae bacterium]